ncbi:sigma 54-interacting transcriptional regulator [Candidatus Magnetominusculus xianensis]|uniref:Acetoacetate metabolism regulatory protein AtoC n=1 Tax=Candidatus Magnetominusculus xianensis TaxID=1748249 RepID=A0ABR5SF82_9BACT|nr:sigma 54-interacting transcriptional regulator [Candidatus Magnetominusculus xianensis]KWT85776.1 acetoacetate metabolism regulatory protein AtoC [Candidatus Magnetominusculus xianensis]MBF0405273.1 sigma-54-dependent Fis family transcriptional regulator [Nitrospirota bacterium]
MEVDAIRLTKNAKMLKVLKDAEKAASLINMSVLISGEDSFGKELIARKIHSEGERKHKPFLTISTSAFAADIAEKELFGWKKGTFAGAIEDKTGILAKGNGGTLYIEDIDRIDANLQAKLYKFIVEKKYRPLGSTHAIKSDARVIGSTGRKLSEAVKKGNFREDLYKILKSLEIKLPPLRERKEDLLPMAMYLLDYYSKKYETGHKEFSESAIKFITGYDWPDNLRELSHAIKKSAVLSDTPIIQHNDLILDIPSKYSIYEFLDEKLSKYLTEIGDIKGGSLYGAIISEVEKSLLTIVLKEVKGNQLRASKILGINRNTLRSKIKQYDIKS